MQIGRKYLQEKRNELPKTVGRTTLFIKEILEKTGQGEAYVFDPASLVYLLPAAQKEEETQKAPEEERVKEYILREKEIVKCSTQEEKIREFFTTIIRENKLPDAVEMLREKSWRQQLNVQLQVLLKEYHDLERRQQDFFERNIEIFSFHPDKDSQEENKTAHPGNEKEKSKVTYSGNENKENKVIYLGDKIEPSLLMSNEGTFFSEKQINADLESKRFVYQEEKFANNFNVSTEEKITTHNIENQVSTEVSKNIFKTDDLAVTSETRTESNVLEETSETRTESNVLEETLEARTESNVLEETLESRTESNVLEEALEARTESNVLEETLEARTESNVLAEALETRMESNVLGEPSEHTIQNSFQKEGFRKNIENFRLQAEQQVLYETWQEFRNQLFTLEQQIEVWNKENTINKKEETLRKTIQVQMEKLFVQRKKLEEQESVLISLVEQQFAQEIQKILTKTLQEIQETGSIPEDEISKEQISEITQSEQVNRITQREFSQQNIVKENGNVFDETLIKEVSSEKNNPSVILESISELSAKNEIRTGIEQQIQMTNGVNPFIEENSVKISQQTVEQQMPAVQLLHRIYDNVLKQLVAEQTNFSVNEQQELLQKEIKHSMERLLHTEIQKLTEEELVELRELLYEERVRTYQEEKQYSPLQMHQQITQDIDITPSLEIFQEKEKQEREQKLENRTIEQRLEVLEEQEKEETRKKLENHTVEQRLEVLEEQEKEETRKKLENHPVQQQPEALEKREKEETGQNLEDQMVQRNVRILKDLTEVTEIDSKSFFSQQSVVEHEMDEIIWKILEENLDVSSSYLEENADSFSMEKLKLTYNIEKQETLLEKLPEQTMEQQMHAAELLHRIHKTVLEQTKQVQETDFVQIQEKIEQEVKHRIVSLFQKEIQHLTKEEVSELKTLFYQEKTTENRLEEIKNVVRFSSEHFVSSKEQVFMEKQISRMIQEVLEEQLSKTIFSSEQIIELKNQPERFIEQVIDQKEQSKQLLKKVAELEEQPKQLVKKATELEEQPKQLVKKEIELKEQPERIVKELLELKEQPEQLINRLIELREQPEQFRRELLELKKQPGRLIKHLLELKEYPEQAVKELLELKEQPGQFIKKLIKLEKQPESIVNQLIQFSLINTVEQLLLLPEQTIEQKLQATRLLHHIQKNVIKQSRQFQLEKKKSGTEELIETTISVREVENNLNNSKQVNVTQEENENNKEEYVIGRLNKSQEDESLFVVQNEIKKLNKEEIIQLRTLLYRQTWKQNQLERGIIYTDVQKNVEIKQRKYKKSSPPMHLYAKHESGNVRYLFSQKKQKNTELVSIKKQLNEVILDVLEEQLEIAHLEEGIKWLLPAEQKELQLQPFAETSFIETKKSNYIKQQELIQSDLLHKEMQKGFQIENFEKNEMQERLGQIPMVLLQDKKQESQESGSVVLPQDKKQENLESGSVVLLQDKKQENLESGSVVLLQNRKQENPEYVSPILVQNKKQLSLAAERVVKKLVVLERHLSRKEYSERIRTQAVRLLRQTYENVLEQSVQLFSIDENRPEIFLEQIEKGEIREIQTLQAQGNLVLQLLRGERFLSEQPMTQNKEVVEAIQAAKEERVLLEPVSGKGEQEKITSWQQLAQRPEIRQLIENHEIRIPEQQKEKVRNLQYYQNHVEKIEQLRTEQQEQFQQLMEKAVLQEEKIVQIEQSHQKLKQQLQEKEKNPSTEDLEAKMLQKFQEQLRMERLRRGLI